MKDLVPEKDAVCASESKSANKQEGKTECSAPSVSPMFRGEDLVELEEATKLIHRWLRNHFDPHTVIVVNWDRVDVYSGFLGLTYPKKKKGLFGRKKADK